jgi:V8-like Glu-specific endopeptidase
MNVSATRFEYDIDTVGGQSGAPIYGTNNGQVIAVGIHTNGGALTNSGTRIRSDIYQNILKWKSEGDNL